MTARLDLLDRWRAHETAAFRASEPPGWTRGYIDYEQAYAYARLGNLATATELATRATATLAPAHGSIQGYLRAAYAERVADAIAGKPAGTITVAEQQYPKLHRDARWPIDGLLCKSRVLTHRWIDALGNYSDRKPLAIRIDEIRATPGDRSQAYAALLDQMPAPAPPAKGRKQPRGPSDETIIFHGVLDGLIDLEPDRALPLLERVVTLLDRPNADPEAFGTALAAAVRLGGELVPRVVALSCAHARENSIMFDRVFWGAIRVLQHRPEVTRELLAAASIKGKKKVRPSGYGIAAARFTLGDSTGATALLEEMRPARESLTDGELVGLVAGLAFAYTVAPEESAMAGLESLFGVYNKLSCFDESPFHDVAIGINSAICLGIAGE